MPLNIPSLTPDAKTVLGGSVIKPPAPVTPVVPEMREFGDATATRNNIYNNAIKAAQTLPPVENERYSLHLKDVDWLDGERFTRKQRKHAVVTGQTLARRMRGTWQLYDRSTGQMIGERQQVVGAVPYLSSLGTFTHRGNEYTVNHQQRLKGGVFARRKDNGELESHFNILPGKGISHRYFIDPANSVFKMKLGQSEIPLMPLLRAMGTTDKELRDAWGDAVWQANMGANNDAVLRKFAMKLLPKKDYETADLPTATERLVQKLTNMELDSAVTAQTLGKPYDRVNKDAVLAATSKLLKIIRKEAQPDDRDHLAYQQFLGPEDLFAERLVRDHGNVRRGLLHKLTYSGGDLAKMPSGALTPQLEQVLIGSGLAQALEEINPAEVLDKQSRITRMGEGGIPSLDSIPDEARSVQPSHMSFIDPIRTPESFRAGVDLYMARTARKGSDGRIYTKLKDRTGNLVWKSPDQLANSTITTPDAFKWKTNLIPAMRAGIQDYVPRDAVDYTVPVFSNVFSPLSTLVPFMSATKPGRIAMGARYITQALPLLNAESPLVQGGIPDDPEKRSYEQDYGKHMGAIRAKQGGRVMKIDDGIVHVKYNDGSKDQIELYQHHPLNRKTFMHQTPVLRVGDTFEPNQLLARSNFTDSNGTTALGLNMRVAYMAYKGLNFEDAAVISESAAKRMTSEHMYQHDLAISDKHKTGKNAYVSLFPGKLDKKTLAKYDNDGVIKHGETVEYGQPLILAAKERDRAQNKIHKKRQPGYSDDSVIWNHHDPGVVTDVVWGRSGPAVLVKSTSQMQVGDKLSGRYGDKGVISAIIPDDQMPQSADGRPYELLLSPDGIITRTNPSQTIEAAIGKLAEKLGHPITVPDFTDIDDLSSWAEQQLRKHNIEPEDTVYLPDRNLKVPAIGTGNRFIMKLHHTAESKAQGRDSGAYSADETPAKGGETGCFVGDTGIICTAAGNDLSFTGDDEFVAALGLIVSERRGFLAKSVELPRKRDQRGQIVYREITDYFAYSVPADELVTVELENGELLHVTPQHEFVLANLKKVPVGMLRVGDDLLEVTDGRFS